MRTGRDGYLAAIVAAESSDPLIPDALEVRIMRTSSASGIRGSLLSAATIAARYPSRPVRIGGRSFHRGAAAPAQLRQPSRVLALITSALNTTNQYSLINYQSVGD